MYDFRFLSRSLSLYPSRSILPFYFVDIRSSLNISSCIMLDSRSTLVEIFSRIQSALMMRSVCFISVTVLTFAWAANAKNILFLAGLPSPSHHIWNREIVNALSAKEYNVTVLSTDVDSVKPSNVHYLLLNGVYDNFHTEHVKTLFDTTKNTNPFKVVMDYHDACSVICECNY